MSLIRRRKSPGWGKTPIKRSVRSVSGVKKVVSRKKIVEIVKPVKIVNPISRKKINLNGPTHKRLIREKVLDASGFDIRSKKLKPKPQKSKKPQPRPRLFGDVMGNIMSFMPEKEMVKVSKLKKEYPVQSLRLSV